MKNNMKFLAIALFAFVVGVFTSNMAVSDVPANYKVAVVDVQKVITSSSQVQALKTEQTKKTQEITKFLETAKTAINKETDAAKKKALEEKYNKEFQTKRASIAKNYETKLLEIDKNITNIINTKAKADGYNLVLAKSVVLSGGTDITADIAKIVK